MINIANCWKKEICSNTVVTIGDYVLDLYIHLAGHVTQEGEDDKASKDTGHAVPQRHHQGIPDPDKQRVPLTTAVSSYIGIYNNLLAYKGNYMLIYLAEYIKPIYMSKYTKRLLI